jgi:thioredoxin 1|tara:strand:+ start:259 stop:594 length:336 start_codon:yes stop_codon:yes gene_type:complete
MGTSDAIVEVNDENFEDQIEKIEGLHMIDFWAVWCGPCRMIAPIVEDLADEYDGKGLRVAKIDVDSNPSTTARFRVTSIPSVLFFKDGELIDRVVGAVPRASLEEKILQHL